MRVIIELFWKTVILTSAIYFIFISELIPVFSNFKSNFIAFMPQEIKIFIIMLIFMLCLMTIEIFTPN